MTTWPRRRLQFAAALPLTPVLTQELLTFKVKIDPQTAHDSYSAWREKDHDDLVLALAMSIWWGERQAGARVPDVNMRHSLDPRLLRRPVSARVPAPPGRWQQRAPAPPAPLDRIRRLWSVDDPYEDDY